MKTENTTINRKVEAYVIKELKEEHLPALSVAVMKGGKLIYSKAFGYSNLEHKVTVKLNTVFSIASITKSFTAIATMINMQEEPGVEKGGLRD